MPPHVPFHIIISNVCVLPHDISRFVSSGNSIHWSRYPGNWGSPNNWYLHSVFDPLLLPIAVYIQQKKSQKHQKHYIYFFFVINPCTQKKNIYIHILLT